MTFNLNLPTLQFRRHQVFTTLTLLMDCYISSTNTVTRDGWMVRD